MRREGYFQEQPYFAYNFLNVYIIHILALPIVLQISHLHIPKICMPYGLSLAP